MNTRERCESKLGQGGFTLIELVIVIVVLGIIAAVAIPKFGNFAENSKINATKEEMIALKRAIVGNPAAVSGGSYIDRGFEGDVGFAPSSLTDLIIKPGSVSVYNQLTRLGWNGAYIDSSGGDYIKDAWGDNYVYSFASRTITSTAGGGTSIVVSF